MSQSFLKFHTCIYVTIIVAKVSEISCNSYKKIIMTSFNVVVVIKMVKLVFSQQDMIFVIHLGELFESSMSDQKQTI